MNYNCMYNMIHSQAGGPALSLLGLGSILSGNKNTFLKWQGQKTKPQKLMHRKIYTIYQNGNKITGN